MVAFKYPEKLHGENFSKTVWRTSVGEIKKLNEDSVLSKLRNNVTNYAVYTGKNGSWQLRYVGQTKSILARSRLTNHLISKDDGTGAKLELVQKAVRGGLDVALKLIKVEPEALRHYIEERIINDYADRDSLDWNKQLKGSS